MSEIEQRNIKTAITQRVAWGAIATSLVFIIGFFITYGKFQQQVSDNDFLIKELKAETENKWRVQDATNTNLFQITASHEGMFKILGSRWNIDPRSEFNKEIYH